MKKDVLIAIFIGFILGGSLALIVTNLPNLLQKNPTNIVQTTFSSPTPADNIKLPESEILLTIEKPENESLADKKTVSVSGKSTPGNLVLIESDLESQDQIASSDGSFLQKITLSEGRNQILVSSYNQKGEGITKTINVYYTEEKL